MNTHRPIPRKQILGFVVINLAGLLLILALFSLNQSTRAVTSDQGILTVESDAFAHGTVFLAGPVLLYYGSYTPDTLPLEPDAVSGSLLYSGDYSNTTYSLTFRGEGCNHTFFLFPLLNHYRAWINGAELAADTPIPLTSSNLFSLSDFPVSDEGTWQLVVQIGALSDASSSYAGMILGSETQLKQIHFFWISLGMVAIGIYFYLIFHCLSLFLQKKSETYLLYFCLLIVQALLRSIDSSMYPFAYAIAGTPLSPFLRALSVLNLPLRILILASLFPRIVQRKWVYLAAALCLSDGVSLIGQATGNPAFAMIHNCCNQLSIAMDFVFILRAYIRRETGSPVLFAGIILYGAMRIFRYHTFYAPSLPNGIVEYLYSPWQYGHLLYMFSYAITINGIFARKYQLADELAHSLSVLNESLQEKVEQRTRDLTISNEKLQSSYEALITFQQQKNVFLNNVVHNLRSPLFSLRGSIEMLQARNQQPELRTPLQKSLGKLDYIQRMINDLFLLVRLDDHTVAFHTLRFDLALLLRQITDDYEQAASARDITIARRGYSSPVFLSGDSYYLRQAIENVLDNAIRHSPPGGCIDIALSSGEHHCVLSIADQGAGIPAKDLPHIFERYYTGTARTGSQSGLDLAITKEIIEIHGGTVHAANRSGSPGAVFTLSIPMESAAEDPLDFV